MEAESRPRPQSARAEVNLKGARTPEQLTVDYGKILQLARNTEGALRSAKTNLETCGVERNIARSEATGCRDELDVALKRGNQIERDNMHCQTQMEKCLQLQNDYALILQENEYLKSELQRMGGPVRPPVQSPPRREPPPYDARPAPRPTEVPRARRVYRPPPPPESPTCAIL